MRLNLIPQIFSIYNIKLFLFTLFIFYFDLGIKNLSIFGINFTIIDLRLTLLLIFPILFYEFVKDYKKNLKKYIYFFLAISLLTVHYLSTTYFYAVKVTNIQIIKFFISLFYIFVIFFYLEFIIKNFKNFIKFFLSSFFFIQLLFSTFNYFHNETVCLFGCFSYNREIYKEASHFAYIAPLVVIYYLNVVSFKNLKIHDKFYLLFFFVCILKNLSTTLLASIILSYVIIFIFNYENINKKKFVFITIFFIFLIPFDRNTITKIDHFYHVSPYYDNLKSKINDKTFNYKTKKIYPSEKFKINEGTRKNLSIEVMITNFKLALASIRKNYFGWGLHNYSFAHKTIINKVNDSNVKGVGWLNATDGSNNLNKGLVEFGFLYLFPLLLLFKFLVDKKYDISSKYLIFPVIFSQIFIRGSGFFNAGFIIFILILFYIYLKKHVNRS